MELLEGCCLGFFGVLRECVLGEFFEFAAVVTGSCELSVAWRVIMHGWT